MYLLLRLGPEALDLFSAWATAVLAAAAAVLVGKTISVSLQDLVMLCKLVAPVVILILVQPVL